MQAYIYISFFHYTNDRALNIQFRSFKDALTTRYGEKGKPIDAMTRKRIRRGAFLSDRKLVVWSCKTESELQERDRESINLQARISYIQVGR